MSIGDFIQTTNLDDMLLLGYYGGGNYGDELLLEVLQNMFAQQGIQSVYIAYQEPDAFQQLHHNFGYTPFSIRDKIALFRNTLKSKSIAVGGGGLWGVDMNLNTFQMSIYLWLCSKILRKNVYLLGVGYYRSTTRLGHIGAWLASHAADLIIARDRESYENFKMFAEARTFQDRDIAWYIETLSLERYAPEAAMLSQELHIRDKTFFVTLRRLQAKRQHDAFTHFTETIGALLAANADKKFVLTQLELSTLDPLGAKRLRAWSSKNKNIRLLDRVVNPLVLYTVFHEYAERIALIGPQFHIMLTAHLNHVPFLPISYDNKVSALLDSIGIGRTSQIAIADVRLDALQQFINAQIANHEGC